MRRLPAINVAYCYYLMSESVSQEKLSPNYIKLLVVNFVITEYFHPKKYRFLTLSKHFGK